MACSCGDILKFVLFAMNDEDRWAQRLSPPVWVCDYFMPSYLARSLRLINE
jgi:hypothetical protein